MKTDDIVKVERGPHGLREQLATVVRVDGDRVLLDFAITSPTTSPHWYFTREVKAATAADLDRAGL